MLPSFHPIHQRFLSNQSTINWFCNKNKRTIENLLQQDVYANAGHCSNIDASKVEALNRSFTEVTKQLKQVCAKQAEEVEKELSHLDLTLEMLDEIEIPKVIDQEIQDAVSKCDKVTDLLDKI